MVDAVKRIATQDGQVAVLVNNAGFGVLGAAEEIPVSQVRRQFDTNVFGRARLT
jgi:NAD(P)-dependent dehydrogenase (short-subunit alcohol dehydrogenase family)